MPELIEIILVVRKLASTAAPILIPPALIQIQFTVLIPKFGDYLEQACSTGPVEQSQKEPFVQTALK